MKINNIFTALAAAVLLTFSSCYDMDRYPEDKLSSGTFFKTQDHADQAMMGVYNQLKTDHTFGIQFALDCLGGVGTGFDNYSYFNFMKGTYDVANSWVLNKWKYLYEGVTRANIVLQNIDNVDMSDQLKAQYKGEAKFLRALFYNSLMSFFGGVPIYDENFIVAADFNNMLNPRESEETVRSLILSDLDEAINTLPKSWDSPNYGRATSGAAQALKGKVLLFNKQYSEAAKCFEAVKNSGQYALYDDYAGLFLPGGDESNEMIFAIQNLGGVGFNYGMPMCFYMGTRASFGSCWNNAMVSTYFVDSYEWKDGRPFDWEEVVPGFTTNNDIKNATFGSVITGGTKVTRYTDKKETLLEMYANRDPRMNATVILPYTWYGGWYKNAPHDCEYVVPFISSDMKHPVDGNHMIRVQGNYYYYPWRKFVPEYDMDGAITNRSHTPINFPLIRYADVLLMLAECYNEMGDQEGAVRLINEVRARPSVNMPGLNSGPAWLKATTKEEVFERIRHERAVEFAGEGLSFDDMRRWGLLETLNGRKEVYVNGTVHFTRSTSSRDYLWPIPSDEIFQNPSLTQNPGW